LETRAPGEKVGTGFSHPDREGGQIIISAPSHPDREGGQIIICAPSRAGRRAIKNLEHRSIPI